MRRKLGFICCIAAIIVFMTCSPEKLARKQVPGLGQTQRIMSSSSGNMYGTVVITSMRDLGDRYEISYCTKISASTGNALKPTAGVGTRDPHTITVPKQYSGYIGAGLLLVGGLVLLSGVGSKSGDNGDSIVGSSTVSLSDALLELKKKRDSNEISDSEYMEQKKKLLEKNNA